MFKSFEIGGLYVYIYIDLLRRRGIVNECVCIVHKNKQSAHAQNITTGLATKSRTLAS